MMTTWAAHTPSVVTSQATTKSRTVMMSSRSSASMMASRWATSKPWTSMVSAMPAAKSTWPTTYRPRSSVTLRFAKATVMAYVAWRPAMMLNSTAKTLRLILGTIMLLGLWLVLLLGRVSVVVFGIFVEDLFFEFVEETHDEEVLEYIPQYIYLSQRAGTCV
ncbi:hypothetical protein K458DRAFT_201057 [Lentithecium fluviatile CBS 122367]|uniref:Uncharacterized protein n=1 Tax=Lentithecium fluviatile CBS 122367 TaxID=1168545 RepID=A0A6G1J807_9PLEO|nr:hypothetical protein K458DRAFT_201057 [Lentithecium fluviatile CBS 122367]